MEKVGEQRFLGVNLLALNNMLIKEGFTFTSTLARARRIFQGTSPISSCSVVVGKTNLYNFFVTLRTMGGKLGMLVMSGHASPKFSVTTGEGL